MGIFLRRISPNIMKEVLVRAYHLLYVVIIEEKIGKKEP